nr:GntR family transcriptional regulator [Gammaproteobacteria bacterium]
ASATDCSWQAGDEISLFVRTDDEGNPVATTEKPPLTLHQSALLEVVTVRDTGTWLDWGLQGDLFMPRSECRFRVQTGDRLLVCLYRDASTGRLAASTRLHKFLSEQGMDLRPGQPVSLIVAGKTELGFKAVIDQRYLGLLFADEVFQPLNIGDALTGYIKSIRPDGKIDLTLQAKPTVLRDELSERILQDLKTAGGRSTLTDKSSPEEIYARYQVSKKNYKKALGGLYRQRRIVISASEITLAE